MTGPARFRPVPWLPGPHLQTIVPSLFPGPAVDGPTEHLVVRVKDDSAVRLDVNRPPGAPRGTLLLVHGMCGCSESSYMRRSARHAIRSGWVAARMNLRNCGGTEHLATTLYNAGQSEDVGHAADALLRSGFPRPLVAVGFSLGGNLVLLYAGRTAESCACDVVAAVNPPIDLEACARAIEAPSNRLYRWHYVYRLCAQLRRVAAVRPLAGPPAVPARIRSVRRFDGLYTAPNAGFASAEEYYRRSSAAPVLERIRRPGWVLSATNDPFVPLRMFDPHRGHPWLDFAHPPRGGHCGYWQSGRPRFWAVQAVLEFVEVSVRGSAPGMTRTGS